MKAIAHPGFLVAFANRHDAHHAWADELAARIEAPLLTCEAVLAESGFHLQNPGVVLEMVREGFVQVDLDVTTNLPHLAALAKRDRDRRPDLADLCIIRISELPPRRSVLTVDESDFRTYRRNKRAAIPIIASPKRSPVA